MKVFELQNPNGTLVKRASIAAYGDRVYLSVETIHRNSSEGFLTMRGAKNFFGRNYQTGAKWKETAVKN